MTAAPAFLLAGADLDLAKWSLGSQILIVLGTSALSMGLRTMAHPALRKIGALGVLATSFFIGWLFTGFWQAGVVCASSWLLLPWLEILTRVRKLTLPLEINLRL